MCSNRCCFHIVLPRMIAYHFQVVISSRKFDGRSTWTEVKLLISLTYTIIMPFLVVSHHTNVNYLTPLLYYNALIDYFACESFGLSSDRSCQEFVTPLHQNISYNVSLTLLVFGIFIPIDKFILTSDFKALYVKLVTFYGHVSSIKRKLASNTQEL